VLILQTDSKQIEQKAAQEHPGEGTGDATSDQANVSRQATQDSEIALSYDFTQIPKELDAKFLAMMQPPPESDNLARRPVNDRSAVRSAIITCGNDWTLTEYENLFAGPKTRGLDSMEQERERTRAYDLLQALSKSGALAFDDVDLHVVIAMTHCFDETLMRTVVQENVNPIESVEHSALLVAAAIHQTDDLAEMLTPAILENWGY
jgi:hypothetical protein